MVWPNQDYFDLTWPRLWNVIANPAMREASPNLAKPGLHGLRQGNWRDRPDLIELAAVSKDGIIHPQRYRPPRCGNMGSFKPPRSRRSLLKGTIDLTAD